MRYSERTDTRRRLTTYTLSEDARTSIRELSAREGVSASSIVERLILEAARNLPACRHLRESACEAG